MHYTDYRSGRTVSYHHLNEIKMTFYCNILGGFFSKNKHMFLFFNVLLYCHTHKQHALHLEFVFNFSNGKTYGMKPYCFKKKLYVKYSLKDTTPFVFHALFTPLINQCFFFYLFIPLQVASMVIRHK